MSNKKQNFYNLIISVCALLCMWLVWVIAWLIVDDGYVIPSFTDTVKEIGALMVSSEFWQAFGLTLARTAISWFAATVLAAAVASAGAVFPAVRKFAAPFIAVFRTVPTMAITLMLLIWSSPRVAPAIVSALIVFPIAYARFNSAFDGIDRKLTDMADVYNVPFGERLAKIYIPQVMPLVLSQIGPDFSLTLKVMVSAEVMCSTFNSLGGLIYQSNVFLNTAQMFALTICTIAAGGILSWLLGLLTCLTRRWTGAGNPRTKEARDD